MDDTAGILSFSFEDEDACALFRLFLSGAMTWSEFLRQPMPHNVSPLEAWEAMKRMMRCVGVHVAVPGGDENGVQLWYCRTYQLIDLAARVSRLAAPDSALSRALCSEGEKDTRADLRAIEASAASRLAGFESDPATLAAARLQEGDQGHGHGLGLGHGIRRLESNMMAIDADLESYVGRRFARDLIEELQARLLEGVDESLLEEDAGRVSVAQGSPARFANAPAWADVFCGYANHDLGAAEDLPVFRGALMTDYVRSFCPFGRASGHMASLLSRLYWRQRGLPALAVAPLSRVRLAWRLGKLELADVLCDRAEYEATYRRDPEDLTVYQTLTAQFACHALAEMERRVSSHVERDVAIGAILRRCSGFNQRQRAVIARSLQVKDARFSIRGHHGEFGVSCTTARRDLAELVREGFLRVVPQGKAYVFVADDRAVKLKEIVDQRAGASDTSGVAEPLDGAVAPPASPAALQDARIP